MPRGGAGFRQLLRDVGERLAAGDGVLVHCNAGLGRTAVVLASILKAHGLAVDPVTELRRIYRSSAMQEPVQEAFVRRPSHGLISLAAVPAVARRRMIDCRVGELIP